MQPTGSSIPPQYEPDQIRAVHADELERHRAPATPATYLIAALLIAGAVIWIAKAFFRLGA